MKYTNVMAVVLAGIMAVSPMQFTNGQVVQQPEERAIEQEEVTTNPVVTGDTAVGGFLLPSMNFTIVSVKKNLEIFMWMA